MTASRYRQLLRRASTRARSHAALAIAFGLTIASNANAFGLPNLPLEIGAAYPPPNVMFILDISGSMDDAHMPDSVPSMSAPDFRNLVYTRNSIYYNPAVTYEPWMLEDSTRQVLTPAVSYTSAPGGTATLDARVDLSARPQVFHVPKLANPTAAQLGQAANYYRYVIASGGASITRSEYNTTIQQGAGYPLTGYSATNGEAGIRYFLTYTAPADVGFVTIRTSGGTEAGNGVNLYVRRGAAPTTAAYDCLSAGSANNETCSFFDPIPGEVYHIGLRNGDSGWGHSFTNVTVDARFHAVQNQSSTLPTSRTLDQEKQNFANWYTYHRTRMKVAKAGASEAFAGLPSSLRIGITNIQNIQTGANRPYMAIPVGNDDGLFRNTNKSTWFTKLRAATTTGSTPLRTGLISVGEYYKDTSATGPWGPESGDRQLSCRQNFAILTTDGYWNRGDEDNNASAFTVLQTLGNVDGDMGVPYADTHGSVGGNESEGIHGPTLADVAMHYWKNDLSADLPDNVPFSLADPANYQHMVTFGISLGLQGTINPANVPAELGTWSTPSTGWPNPIPSPVSTTTVGQAQIDDLLHAAVNSRGEFVVANNAAEFRRGLLDAFTVVAERTASSSGAASNSTQFSTDSRAFLASFVSRAWSGELTGFTITPGAVTEAWRASQRVAAATAAGTRKFFTWNTGVTPAAGSTFPTDTQITALDRSSYTPAVTGAQNVAYLKGDQSRERLNFGDTDGLRDRTSVLGDIVHSVPSFSSDTGTVFIGANDGMMHAFNQTNGNELFAYVPNIVSFNDLALYSSPDYRHSFFVDGPIVVTSRALTPAKNYLVGALGHGGRGLYGLDVTDPATFDATKVLWELSSTAQPTIGNVLGTPLLATLQDNTKVAIVGNGPNGAGGRAVLFVINVATGAVVHRIDTGVGTDNGLMAPRGADFDGDRRVDAVYVGDLEGNIWKFDFSLATSAVAPTVAFSGSPLFAAQDNQSFTADLALATDPGTGKLWVFAASGRFLSNSDVTDASVQSAYGLIDDGSPVANLDALQERTIEVLSTEVSGGVTYAVRGFEENTPLDPAKRGWYIDLDNPRAGERVVTPLLIAQSTLTFLSRTPPLDEDPCNAGGNGYVNSLDAFTGTSTLDPYFGVGDGFINPTDDTEPGLPIGSLGLGNMPTGAFIIGNYMYVSDTAGNFSIVPIIPPTSRPRRSSWHEVMSN